MTLCLQVQALSCPEEMARRMNAGSLFNGGHTMFDEQADQLFATTDPIAERVGKNWWIHNKVIGQIARLQHVANNEAEHVEPEDMLAELCKDNTVPLVFAA
jgi:starvation-inducible DNA-binding protein